MHPSVSRVRSLIAGHRSIVFRLLVVTTLMFAFGYTLVPIYRAVCSALGLNVIALSESQAGAGTAAARNSQIDASRTVTIEFDANVRGPWDFKPERASIDVHPGQVSTMMYSFRNRQNRAVALQAIPSYAPGVAMAHFTKLECFCFSQQVLQAGESKRWPVVFVVDSKLPKDVKTITLSYTFFEVGGKVPAEPLASAGRGGDAPDMSQLHDADAGDAVRRKGSLARTVRAVGGSFFGVRKARDLERDAKELNPLHVVLVGVAAAALFVVVLVVLVNWVIASGVAS